MRWGAASLGGRLAHLPRSLALPQLLAERGHLVCVCLRKQARAIRKVAGAQSLNCRFRAAQRRRETRRFITLGSELDISALQLLLQAPRLRTARSGRRQLRMRCWQLEQ